MLSFWLSNGLRSRGGQRKCYKDPLKVDLKKTDTNIKSGEELAVDRLQWCCNFSQAAACFRVKCLALRAEKRTEEGKGVKS